MKCWLISTNYRTIFPPSHKDYRVREQPIDCRKILVDRDSRIRYYNIKWILAQIIEQLKQESNEANKNLEKSHEDILDRGYTLSNKDTDRKSSVKELEMTLMARQKA